MKKKDFTDILKGGLSFFCSPLTTPLPFFTSFYLVLKIVETCKASEELAQQIFLLKCVEI